MPSNTGTSTPIFGISSTAKEKGDPDGAIAEFRAHMELRPDDEEAHFILADELDYKGDDGAEAEWIEGSIAKWRTRIRLGPGDPEAHFMLGVALRNKGDREGSVAEFRAAIRLRAGHALAHYNLGLQLQGKGDHVAASEEIAKAHELDPNNRWIARAYEVIRRKAGGHP